MWAPEPLPPFVATLPDEFSHYFDRQVGIPRTPLRRFEGDAAPPQEAGLATATSQQSDGWFVESPQNHHQVITNTSLTLEAALEVR
jgi:hypothetical protein